MATIYNAIRDVVMSISLQLFSTPLIGFMMWLLIFSLPMWETAITALVGQGVAFDDTSTYEVYINRFSEFPWLVIVLKWLLLVYLRCLRVAMVVAHWVVRFLKPLGIHGKLFVKVVLIRIGHMLHSPLVVLFKSGSMLTRIPFIARQLQRIKGVGTVVHLSHEITDRPSRVAYAGVKELFQTIALQMCEPRNIFFIDNYGLAWVAIYTRGYIVDVSIVVLFAWDRVMSLIALVLSILNYFCGVWTEIIHCLMQFAARFI